MYLAFSGIVNHKTFVEMLKNNKLKIVSDLEYPDHYEYSKKDFDEIIIKAKKYDANIITTEKDYLRLGSFNRNEILYIKSSLNISDEKSLTNKLSKLNEKN
jgi:tetraacyldisaccharide 4'-kinase